MSYKANGQGFVDFTGLLALEVRTDNPLRRLGVFKPEDDQMLVGEIAEYERELLTATDMYITARNSERQFVGGDKIQNEIAKVPFSTLDTSINQKEMLGFRKVARNEVETLDNVVSKRIRKIQASHALYERKCMYTALVDNKVYAVKKDGTEDTGLAKNFSTMWSAPRQTGTLDLMNEQANPFDAFEKQRTTIRRLAGDGADGYELVYWCGAAQFNKITSNAQVTAAYDAYKSEQEPLRKRLGLTDQDDNIQVFKHKGVLVIGDGSTDLIPDSDGASGGRGYLFPLGIADMFQGAYAVSSLLSDTNKEAKRGYMFTNDINPREFVLESEIAYMSMITRPELITDFSVTINT